MHLEPYAGYPDASQDTRNLRIHKWISTLPNDLARHHHYAPPIPDAIGARSDSPLLGFTSQESASNDPLHRPSPNYIRRLPEEAVLTNKRAQHDKSLPSPPLEVRVPPHVPEVVEKASPVTRNTPRTNPTKPPAHLSYIQDRRPIPRQPSLPAFGTMPYHHQTSGAPVMPRTRSYSSAATHSNFSSFPAPQMPQSHMSPPTRAPPPSPTLPTASLSSALERQKLDALVIASGLSTEGKPQADRLGYYTNSSQVYLGVPSVPTALRPSTRDSDAMNSTVTTRTVSSARTSMSLEDLDEFDEDASYYGKDIDSLFSPYVYPARQADEINQLAASQWSLPSPTHMDLDKGPTKLKNKREKFKSFISRFTPHPPLPPTDKHATLTAADRSTEKSVRRLRSYSDALPSVGERKSRSSQVAIAQGSWESVPPTPTTATSSTNMSVSTGYSPPTPSDYEGDSRDTPVAAHLSRVSDEKLSLSASLSRIESPTHDTSSSNLTWRGHDTSVPNSPVDDLSPQLPLERSISTTNLRENRLTLPDNSHGNAVSGAKKTAEASQPPRTFKERMMLKNGSALNLILGKGNKTPKPKRKLLISGVERGNYIKYEAISSWCEGFGEVNVKQVADGAIIADFRDASVAETVCRLQARVFIQGAGSVNLSWTTNEISSLSPPYNIISLGT